MRTNFEAPLKGIKAADEAQNEFRYQKARIRVPTNPSGSVVPAESHIPLRCIVLLQVANQRDMDNLQFLANQRGMDTLQLLAKLLTCVQLLSRKSNPQLRNISVHCQVAFSPILTTLQCLQVRNPRHRGLNLSHRAISKSVHQALGLL